MGRFVLKRFLSFIPTLLVIIIFGFIIIRAAPGGPFSREKAVPPAVLANLQAKYHLDEPIYKQFLRYFWDLLHGDFGPSYRLKDFSVNQLIGMALPVSLVLGSIALLIAVLVGVITGIISALKQNKVADYAIMAIAVTGNSMPTFVVGPLLMLVFAIWLKLVPTAGWIDRFGYKALILPVITLALNEFARIARVMRASMIETLRSDYVRTARAKGLSMPTIIVKHVLKGASLPVVSLLGPALAEIVVGAVATERIFAIPGMGRQIMNASTNRDYTLLMGTIVTYAIVLIVMNFIVDIAYGLLDPRISYK
jgi:oligopeptide transport system permease protein